MELTVLPGRLAVAQVPGPSSIPWEGEGPLFIARTEDELSLVCREEQVPPGCRAIEPGWRAIRVIGTLDFYLVGILAELTALLARQGVSVFAVSTYNTDYVLVREEKLAAAVNALTAGGHPIRGLWTRPLVPEETAEAMALCDRVFDEFDGPDYSPGGREGFHAFTRASEATGRAARGEMACLGCYDGGRLVGVGTTREPDHICLLFVEGAWHRRGVGRLLMEAIAQGRRQMTVHASPYGLGFYQRLGFTPTGPEQTVDGLRYIPMRWVPQE